MPLGKNSRDMQTKLDGHLKDVSRLESKKLPQKEKRAEVQRAEKRHTAIAEEDAKYRSKW